MDSNTGRAVRFFNLVTGNTFVSIVFKPMPMPVDVEDYMNKMAEQYPVQDPILDRAVAEREHARPRVGDVPVIIRRKPDPTPPAVTLDKRPKLPLTRVALDLLLRPRRLQKIFPWKMTERRKPRPRAGRQSHLLSTPSPMNPHLEREGYLRGARR